MKALKKRTLIILVIILLALISFGGIFIQKTKFVENIFYQSLNWEQNYQEQEILD